MSDARVFVPRRDATPRYRPVPDELGPLVPLATDPAVTDVLVAGQTVWIDCGAGVVDSGTRLPDESSAQRLAISLAAAAGRHLDHAAPFVSGVIGRGVRVHVVLAGVSHSGSLVSVRLPSPRAPNLEELDRMGAFSDGVLEELRRLVAARANVLVTGATGSGKTTLVAALLADAAPDERIVVIEDVPELQVAHPHVIRLVARQAGIEGTGAVTMRELVRQSLRMRPDRLVLGECRGAEIVDVLGALNTGHDGGMTTLHATSLEAVPARLEAVGMLAGVPADAVARLAASGLNAVVHVERGPRGRRVAVIAHVTPRHRGGMRLVRWGSAVDRRAGP